MFRLVLICAVVGDVSEKKASAAEVRIISETFVESVVYLSKKTVLPEPSFVSVPDQLKRLAAAEADEDRYFPHDMRAKQAEPKPFSASSPSRVLE